MKTVFLFISDHVHSSDILRTAYIKYLSQKYRVIVFLPPFIFQDLDQYNYHQNENIVYLEWQTKNRKLWEYFQLLRFACVRQFDSIYYMKVAQQRPVFKSWDVQFLRKISWPFSKFLTTDFFFKIERTLIPQSKLFLKYCQEYQPTLVLASTPGLKSIEDAEVIVMAKRAGIPSVAMDFTWDNLSTNANHIRKSDYLICWNDMSRQEALELHHYPESRVFVGGALRFDHNFRQESQRPSREEFLLSKNLNPRNKTIFYTTVTNAYPFQKKYLRELLEFREKWFLVEYPNIFVRTHPLDDYENYREFLGIKDLSIEYAGRPIQEGPITRGKIEMAELDLLNLKYSLMYTDVNVNFLSTVSLDACILDQPIVNIGFIDRYKDHYQFDFYKPLVEEKAVRVAHNSDEFLQYLNMYLADPKIDREGRQKITRDFFPVRDGTAYEKSVDFLDTIIQKENR